jgi:hypothetical protein
VPNRVGGTICAAATRLPRPPPRPAPASLAEPWVFGHWSRYCPQCLACDGSPIQDAHGGAWQRLWRLPPVFACTVHRRLLADRCPACRQPTLRLPRCPRAEGLHPAQCCNNVRTTSRGVAIPCEHPLGLTAGHLGPGAELHPRRTALLARVDHRSRTPHRPIPQTPADGRRPPRRADHSARAGRHHRTATGTSDHRRIPPSALPCCADRHCSQRGGQAGLMTIDGRPPFCAFSRLPRSTRQEIADPTTVGGRSAPGEDPGRGTVRRGTRYYQIAVLGATV